MYLNPNPIGVNQLGLVQAWISPRPMYPERYYYNYIFTFTNPNGAIDTFTVPMAEQTGSIWFDYMCDQAGNWTVEFSWDGSDTPTAPSGNHTAASTTAVWVVQDEPVPSWPPAELPTDGWDWPINPENREWYQLAGAWLQSRYNASQGSYNPYSEGPESSHVLRRLPPRALGLT